jgi:16S rRNA (guanine966-N2)-methyltransferase
LVEIRRCDLTNIIKNPDKKFDLVFLDPPYHSNLGEIAISNFLKEGWLSEDSIIVFESNKEILLKEFECLDCRKYGKTFVNVFRSMNN